MLNILELTGLADRNWLTIAVNPLLKQCFSSILFSNNVFSGPRYNVEMGSKGEISPYLFNHHYDSNNPKYSPLNSTVSENGGVENMPTDQSD